VDFLFGTPQAPQAVRLKSEMVGALLVAYCIRIRIPMPKKGRQGCADRIELRDPFVPEPLCSFPGANCRSPTNAGSCCSYLMGLG
jgi:hypothetical protein